MTIICQVNRLTRVRLFVGDCLSCRTVHSSDLTILCLIFLSNATPSPQRNPTNPLESRDGAVVRPLASRQCDPGLNPELGVICGLSLLLVLVLAPNVSSPGTPVFPSPQKPTSLNSNSISKVYPISALREIH